MEAGPTGNPISLGSHHLSEPRFELGDCGGNDLQSDRFALHSLYASAILEPCQMDLPGGTSKLTVADSDGMFCVTS